MCMLTHRRSSKNFRRPVEFNPARYSTYAQLCAHVYPHVRTRVDAHRQTEPERSCVRTRLLRHGAQVTAQTRAYAFCTCLDTDLYIGTSQGDDFEERLRASPFLMATRMSVHLFIHTSIQCTCRHTTPTRTSM